MKGSARFSRYSSWRVFQEDLSTVNRLLHAFLEDVANWLFSFDQNGARRRLIIFGILTLILWIWLALLTHPIRPGVDPFITQLGQSLFSAGVIRHFVVLMLALWVGLRLAAIYLDDIFELNDVSIAERFIRQAAFPNRYSYLVIREGDIAPEYRQATIVRIGGPGKVDVHLENAALFEYVDGTPHIVEPTFARPAVLAGFERLRAIIDLRDQIFELNVDGRTQDGIIVQAKDVRLVFSVYRGQPSNVDGDALEQPYPFDKSSIHDLVYKQGRGPWVETMRSLIRNELREFISKHTLSEFLANADDSTNGDFYTRDYLTNLFYDFASGFSQAAKERGVQIAWIGVGTWVTPSQIIPARHLEAWKLSTETRVLKSPAYLEKTRSDSRTAELLRLVDDVLATFYHLVEEDTPPDEVIRSLALYYREKLRHAKEAYIDQNQPVPKEVDEAIRRLTMTGEIVSGEKPGED
jgi:hypothetical protein